MTNDTEGGELLGLLGDMGKVGFDKTMGDHEAPSAEVNTRAPMVQQPLQALPSRTWACVLQNTCARTARL